MAKNAKAIRKQNQYIKNDMIGEGFSSRNGDPSNLNFCPLLMEGDQYRHISWRLAENSQKGANSAVTQIAGFRRPKHPPIF